MPLLSIQRGEPGNWMMWLLGCGYVIELERILETVQQNRFADLARLRRPIHISLIFRQLFISKAIGSVNKTNHYTSCTCAVKQVYTVSVVPICNAHCKL